MDEPMVGATPREQFDNLKLDFLLRLMGKVTPVPKLFSGCCSLWRRPTRKTFGASSTR
jgi:hypothetical protein